jgi:PAS domain S-box-containing protein
MKNAKPKREPAKTASPERFERQMRDLVNYNLDGILVVGLDGVTLFANPAACTLLNRPLASLLDVEIGLPLSGADYTEIEIRHPDGSLATVEMRVHSIEWEGQPAWLADLRDITERRQAQEALRASEEKMRSIFRAAPTGIGVVCNRVLMDVNHRICEMTGYAKEELIGQSARMLYPTQEDFDFVGREKYRQIAGAGTGQVETRWRKKDGAVIDILLASTPIDNKDLSKGVTFTALDITERKLAEDALRKSEERHRQISTLMSDYVYYGVAFPDGSTETQWVSGAFERITGYTKEEVNQLQGGYSSLVFPEDLQEVLRQYPSLIKNGTLTVEYRLRCKNGEICWMRDYIQYVKSSGLGSPALMLGAVQDITERKRAELALMENEAMLKDAERNARLGYYDIEIASGKAIWSDETYRIFGLERDSYNPDLSNYEMLLHPEDRMKVYQLYEECIREQKPFNLTYRIIRPDGEIRHVHSISSMKKNPDDTQRLFGTIQDVTERVQAEQDLRVALVKFKTLFESFPLGITIADKTGKILESNRMSEHLLGISQEEHRQRVLGGSTWKIVRPDGTPMPPEEYASVRALRENSIVQNVELGIVKGDASITWLNVTAAPLPLEGYGVVVTYGDITEQKRAELALARNEHILRLFVEHSPAAIAMFDRDMRYIVTSRRYLTDFGLGEQNLAGRSHYEVFPEMTEERKEIHRQCLAGAVVKNDADPLLRPNGKLDWVRYELRPWFEANGEVGGLIFFSEVITGQIQARDALIKNEALLREAQHMGRIGHWECILPSEDLLCSDEFFEILEIPRPDNGTISQHTIVEMVKTEDRQRLADMDIAAIANRSNADYEFKINLSGGRVRWLHQRIQITYGEDGKPTRMMGVVQDITERKQAEAEIQIQIQRITALNEIDRAISSSLDMRLSLDVLLSETIMQLGVDAASILLLNPIEQELEFITGQGFRSPRIRQTRERLGQGLAGKPALTRKVLHIPHLREAIEDSLRKELLQEEDFVEYFGVPLIAKGEFKGVLEIFNRTNLHPGPDWLDYLETLGGQAAIAIDNAQMFERLQRSNQEMMIAYDATIEGWSRAMDLRDEETEGHTRRVTELSLRLAEKMGVGDQERVQMRRGALLHDIGKLGVPDNILLKPGKLTDEEWGIMRQHPTRAYEMLLPIKYLRLALDIPYAHHEKWDGTGYPRGLKGEQIPLAARIFAIVDVWDALRSDRLYRKGWATEKIREYILAESGKHFDPQVVRAFMELMQEDPGL